MASAMGVTALVLGLLLAGTLVGVITRFQVPVEIVYVILVLGVALIIVGAVTRSFVWWFGLAALVVAAGLYLATWISKL